MKKLFAAIVVMLSLAALAAAEQARVDVERLPIDLERVRQGLKASTFREEREGLRLRYFLNIYGEAPKLVIVPPDGREGNWANGPVPYGAPTHRDFLYLWTPDAFRTPPADLTAVFKWLADRAARRSKPDSAK